MRRDDSYLLDMLAAARKAVRFAENMTYAEFERSDMEDELKEIFGRDVDLVEREGVERSRNYLRRKAILESAETIYAG